MDVKFYLKDPKKKDETAIFCLCHFGYKEKTLNGSQKYKPVKLYTSEKINPKYWNGEKNRARETANFPQHPEFNDTLNTIDSDLKTLFLELSKKHSVVTPELFKREWDLKNNPQPTAPAPENTFAAFAENHINKLEGNVTNGTLKSFRNSLSHIKDFINSKQKPPTIDAIGFDFHFELIEYLKTVKKFAPNTIWRINKFLRYILKYATETGIKTRPDYMSKRFSVSAQETDVIYLNDSELIRIYNTDLATDKKLQRVRDLFLIGCFTGLRFSDFNRLNPENIKIVEGKQLFKLTTQKTGEPVYIPLNPIVIEIISKYSGLPKGMSNQKFNDYLKDVAKEAKLNDLVTVEETKGNLTAQRTVFKWQLVTSHTARRSFATNAFKAGIEPIKIMLITGHKTETAFLRYIRITKEENALLLSTHEHFNRPILKIAE